jgi:hypothetical protein
VSDSYLAPEELVDAALAGLDVGESVTIPSILDEQPWTALEAARTEFVKAVMSGKLPSDIGAQGVTAKSRSSIHRIAQRQSRMAEQRISVSIERTGR